MSGVWEYFFSGWVYEKQKGCNNLPEKVIYENQTKYYNFGGK